MFASRRPENTLPGGTRIPYRSVATNPARGRFPRQVYVEVYADRFDIQPVTHYLTMAGKSKTIVQTEFIPGVKREQVYDRARRCRKHAAFTGAAATGSARVGGKFTAGTATFSASTWSWTVRAHRSGWATTEWPADTPPSSWSGFVEKRMASKVT